VTGPAASGDARRAGARDAAVARRPVTRVRDGAAETGEDSVAVEGALEIRVEGQPLAVTLRTPGHDLELALGLLFAERAIRAAADVAAARATPAGCADEPDVLDLTLAAGVAFDWTRLERRFAATSACGLCGRTHLDSLRSGLEPLGGGVRVGAAGLAALPGRLRELQPGFLATGGLHAAAFLTDNLEVTVVREDVGRHNAADKVVGALLAAGAAPVGAGVLWVSGRAGAEIVLKSVRARIPVLASVGAPTTLAIDLAAAAGLTLVGFLRDGRMNVYAGVTFVLG
jgi:FdhD protein